LKKWWWLVAAAVLVAVAIGVEWRRQHRADIALPVLNHSDESVQLLFYGPGLSEHVMIRELPARDSIVVTLRLAPGGAIRIKSATPRAQVDAQLTDSNAALRDQPLQFEVRPGNQFVLVPRS
jgi:hypothetical protein